MFAFDSVAVDVGAVSNIPFNRSTSADHWGCSVEPQLQMEGLKSNDSGRLLRFMVADHPVSLGLTHGRVAGLEMVTKTDRQWSITAFGGVPTTPVTTKGVVDNLVYGGRIDAHPMPGSEIGVSARIRNGEADKDEADTDFSFNFGTYLTVSGLTQYKASEWRRHRYSFRLRYKSFQLTPVYEYLYARDDTVRFTSKSQLFGFLASDDPVRISGTDLDWKGFDNLSIGLRTRLYDYPLQDESALYYAGRVSLKAATGGHLDLEIGRMQGHLDETRYTLVDAGMVCPNFLGLKSAFFKVDARWVDYDRPVSGRDLSLHTSWGMGFHFLDGHLETKLSGMYGMDPFTGNNAGAMLSIKFEH
jgi:hypothetical protein